MGLPCPVSLSFMFFFCLSVCFVVVGTGYFGLSCFLVNVDSLGRYGGGVATEYISSFIRYKHIIHKDRVDLGGVSSWTQQPFQGCGGSKGRSPNNKRPQVLSGLMG